MSRVMYLTQIVLPLICKGDLNATHRYVLIGAYSSGHSINLNGNYSSLSFQSASDLIEKHPLSAHGS